MESHRADEYANIPIPSYDEAVSGSSHTPRGAQEVSDDAEREGLLRGGSTYRPPAVSSPRESEDSDLHLPEIGDEEERRLNVEELDYLDPHAPDPDGSNFHHRPRIRNKFTQHLSSLGATLSSLRLPSFRSLYSPVEVTARGSSDPDSRPPSSSSASSRFARFLPAIPPVPDQYRMGLPTAARLCALFTIVILIYVLFIFDIFPGGGGRGRYLGRGFNPEAVRMFVQDNVDARSIEDYLHHITAYDHVAGTEGDLYMAEWMRERWIAEGYLDKVELNSYHVYLNYPTPDGREVSIVSPEDKRWKALLEEERVDVEKVQTLAWHGLSKSGDVTGPLVYAHRGRREDFAWLRQQNVALNGTIALMRSQGDPAWNLKAAEDAGCIGALIYSDPSDGGSARGPVWPDGPWRPDDSIQRGGVGLTNWVMGDPLTPGYASTKDAPTISKDDSPGLVQIPSLPLAWRDAKVLLRSIQNVGIPVPDSWVGGDAKFPKIWHSGGNTEDTPHVRVKNLNDENDKQHIWNLHGRIEGVEQPQKKIIIGNHRDAWCFGSTDPGSGSAVLMEIVRIFGQLAYNQWRPLRTIEFVSWDAGEYNLMGSTEYVEDHLEELRRDGVAYLNVDVGVGGLLEDLRFRARGSPMWKRAVMRVLERVDAPGRNGSLKDMWEREGREFSSSLGFAGVSTLGDSLPFQVLAGMSSVDIGFEGKEGESSPPVQNSCYDSFDWMREFGDPEFQWHRALAQVWALLILEVADHPILPLDLTAYADEWMGEYVEDLEAFAESLLQKEQRAGGKEGKSGVEEEMKQDTNFDLTPLRSAAEFFATRARDFVRFEDLWTSNVMGSGGLEGLNYAKHRVKYNNLLVGFEGALLDLPRSKEGKDEGNGTTIGGSGGQFPHVVFGPQRQQQVWDADGDGKEGGGGYFPKVRDALQQGDWEGAQGWVVRIAGILKGAAGGLVLS